MELDQKKLKAALEKVSKHNQSAVHDERKRGYNSFAVRPPVAATSIEELSTTISLNKSLLGYSYFTYSIPYCVGQGPGILASSARLDSYGR